MKIAMSETREKFPLSPKKPLKKTLAYTLWWLILVGIGAVIGLVAAFTNSKASVALIIILAAAVLDLIVFLPTYWYQKWYYAVYFYEIDADYVRIRKGPITPKEITVPFERIQDVYVDQDLLDRLFGLYDVHISSATMSSGIAAHIDGVAQPAADQLKTLLLQTVSAKMRRGAASPTPNQTNPTQQQ
jgi:membrane protein YdbS with pleckstrin-like domain